MANIVGERHTFFRYGEKYTFERVDIGLWKQITGSKMIPYDIKEELDEIDRKDSKYITKNLR